MNGIIVGGPGAQPSEGDSLKIQPALSKKRSLKAFKGPRSEAVDLATAQDGQTVQITASPMRGESFRTPRSARKLSITAAVHSVAAGAGEEAEQTTKTPKVVMSFQQPTNCRCPVQFDRDNACSRHEFCSLILLIIGTCCAQILRANLVKNALATLQVSKIANGVST